MTQALEPSVLEGRLADCRKAKQQRLQQHAQLTAVLEENKAQINALNGREAELVELLALAEPPASNPADANEVAGG